MRRPVHVEAQQRAITKPSRPGWGSSRSNGWMKRCRSMVPSPPRGFRRSPEMGPEATRGRHASGHSPPGPGGVGTPEVGLRHPGIHPRSPVGRGISLKRPGGVPGLGIRRLATPRTRKPAKTSLPRDARVSHPPPWGDPAGRPGPFEQLHAPQAQPRKSLDEDPFSDHQRRPPRSPAPARRVDGKDRPWGAESLMSSTLARDTCDTGGPRWMTGSRRIHSSRISDRHERRGDRRAAKRARGLFLRLPSERGGRGACSSPWPPSVVSGRSSSPCCFPSRADRVLPRRWEC
jgi:hypothetical protein